MSLCKRCDAAIRWVVLDTGRPIPVDPIPLPDKGSVAAKSQGATFVGYVMSAAKPLRPGYSRFMPHHAACKPEEPRVTAGERAPDLFADLD